MQLAWVPLLVTLLFLPHARCLDCSAAVKRFYEWNTREAVPSTGSNLLYFLHVPRTAGRTFLSCLLRQGTPMSQRCPKAYDHLRINFTLPSCRLLSSHDDFSVVQLLPPNTAVVNQLRDPVERVLSAYEFAVEVATRHAFRPKPYKAPKGRTTTDAVWPWSILVPWFTEQIKDNWQKIKAQPLDPEGYWVEFTTEAGLPYYYNRVLNVSKWVLDGPDKEKLLPPLDPYNHPAFMPLSEFIRHPLAEELLHNGEMLQVLGATNYSHWEGAEELRECIVKDFEVANQLLGFAKERLKTFTHVGTTEKLYPSIEAAAAALDMPLDGAAYGGGENTAADLEADSRALSWKEAMERGSAPKPDTTDEFYGEEEKEDIHQLAADVRAARGKVEKARKAWNQAVAEGEAQGQLRKLRASMLRARAEAAAAQDVLVSARSDMLKERKKLQEELVKPKLLDMSLGVEVQRCANKAVKKGKQRRDQSLLNLMLPDGRPLKFGKTARKQIPDEVIQEIRRRNTLDIELHKLGLELLEEKRVKYEVEGKLVQLPDVIAKSKKSKEGFSETHRRGADL